MPVGNLPLRARQSIRYFQRHIGQTLLSILGIAIGVMMVVSVELANDSARRAFKLSVDSASGKTSHQIIGGPEGVAETLYTRIRTELGLRKSAPVLNGRVITEAGESIALLGLDLVAEGSLQRELTGLEGSTLGLAALSTRLLHEPVALISTKLANRLGLSQGELLQVTTKIGKVNLEIARVLPTNAEIIMVDIGTAQTLLKRQGWIDSVDMILTSVQQERVSAWLPANYSLREANVGTAALEQMTKAFQTNLTAMSLLALLVAALLIYNTVSLSVLERRPYFGTLRALGVTPVELARDILIEVVLLSFVATLIGLTAGVILGSWLVELVLRTIDDLYFRLIVSEYVVSGWVLWKAFFWGLGSSVVATLLPALQAAKSLPITLQHKLAVTHSLRTKVSGFLLVGLLLLLGGLFILKSSSSWLQSLLWGFIALFLLIFGLCMWVPTLLTVVLRLLLKISFVRDLTFLRLALRGIETGLDRTALAIAALSVSVSVTIGVGLMVASLRDSVLTWLDESLPGDIQLTWNLDGGGFTAEMQGELEKQLEIKQVIPAWRLTVESSLGQVYLQSSHGEDNESDQSYISNESISEVVQVDIAEASAALYRLEQGKRFMLYTPQGPLQVQINKVFKDYSTGRAVLAIHKNTFQTYWPELLPGRLTLSLHNPNQASIVSIVDRLSESYKNDQLPVEVIPNGAIFKATLTIFDRTFAITTVLRMLAIIVACVGIFSAMLALQIQRQRDYAILRAAGMTSSGVARLLFLQAGIMGVFAGLIALPLGLVMCEVLIQVINKRAFGWSMESVLSGGVLVEAVLLALAASLLAGVLPARKVARVLPQVALRGQEEW